MSNDNLIQDTLPTEMTETAPAVTSATPPAAQAAQATAQAAAPATVTAPVYVGGKKFDNQEQMLSYFSELEARTQAAQVAATPRIEDKDPIEKELSTLLYEDPAAYTKAVMEQAKRDAIREFNTKKEAENAWQTFYEKNPDLKDDKDIVELMYHRESPKLNKMHLDQAMDELAKASRLRLSKLRQIPAGEGKPLHNGPAVTAGATGGPAVQTPVTQKPMTMAEQLMELHRKRSKRA